MVDFKDGILTFQGEGVYVAAGKNLVKDVDMDQVKQIVISENAHVLLVNARILNLKVEKGAAVTIANCAVVGGTSDFRADITITESIVKNCSDLRGNISADRSSFVNCRLIGSTFLNCCFGDCEILGWYHCVDCVFDQCDFEPDDPGDDELYGVYARCTFLDCNGYGLHGVIVNSRQRMSSAMHAYVYLIELMCAGYNNEEFKSNPSYRKLIQYANRVVNLKDDSYFVNAEDALKFALKRYTNCVSDGDKHTIGWMVNLPDNW